LHSLLRRCPSLTQSQILIVLNPMFNSVFTAPATRLYILRSILVLSSNLCLRVSRSIIPSYFPTQLFYVFFTSPQRATYLAHPTLLNLIILITLGKETNCEPSHFIVFSTLMLLPPSQPPCYRISASLCYTNLTGTVTPTTKKKICTTSNENQIPGSLLPMSFLTNSFYRNAVHGWQLLRHLCVARSLDERLQADYLSFRLLPTRIREKNTDN
jgi:hypothetical protein